MDTRNALKTIALVIAAAVGAGALAGCATMKRKFVRKPKERVTRPVVYTDDRFVQQYSNKYYYQTHFSNWRTWHDELLNSMSDNAKRQERAVQEAVKNLEAMRKYLTPERGAELDVQIAQVREAETAIEGGKSARDASVRLQLERTRRIINSSFYYDKVKDSVLADTVDLGAPEPAPATP